jgi:hypothetical protein
MFTYILTAIIAIFLWEVIKDALNIRNIFNKYDGLSSEETLAIRRAEEKILAEQKNQEEEEEETFIDD